VEAVVTADPLVSGEDVGVPCDFATRISGPLDANSTVLHFERDSFGALAAKAGVDVVKALS
jgi:hypothetical protein